jgi:hypothetical protein
LGIRIQSDPADKLDRNPKLSAQGLDPDRTLIIDI